MKTGFYVAMCLIALSIAASGHAQVAQKKTLTLAGAKKAVEAAVAEAKKTSSAGAIAVVDDGGNLLCLERLDGSFAASANISIGKARTAAIFKKETIFFEKLINEKRTAMTSLKDFTPLQGGVPIVVDGEVVGAVGVSGAANAQADEEMALAAAAAFKSAGAAMGSSPPVTYLEAKKVSEAFAKGAPLIETPLYKVHASRREKPGEAEIHTRETDVIHVLEGSATFVTGGKALNPRNIAEDEIRGTEIQGGEARTVSKGDVIIVPNGVPHWFKEVKGPLLYFVVKPIMTGGGPK